MNNMNRLIKTIATITLSISILNPLAHINTTTTATEPTQTQLSTTVYYTTNLQTNEDLEQYATRFLKDNYNLDLEISVTFSSELKDNTNGAFYYTTKYQNKANYIEISTNIKDEHDIERTLIHELIHYALFETNQEFKDGSENFENENYNKGGRSNYNYEVKTLDSKILATCCD